ncbi:MAG: helix-turn-helix transcriptional regulator [Gammaproteobacteria bacterium]|nr:helix-turn-helix transcriptional regulator [Gammaproteobacteria bacterium]
MEILAHTLKKARQAKGLSQAQLAARAGTGQGHISRMERGEKGASSDTLRAVARELDITLARLLGEEPEQQRGISEPDASYSTTNPANAILASPHAPAGLKQLAEDATLIAALNIQPMEWESLTSIRLPPGVDKQGYLQLLVTLRAIIR